MSIKEVGKKSNPLDALPKEEEFDIVTVGSVAKNKDGFRNHLSYIITVTLIGAISFGIGKLVTNDKVTNPITVEYASVINKEVASPTKVVDGILVPSKAIPKTAVVSSKPPKQPISTLSNGPIVASKNGSKYYLTTCSGAKRISDANKVYFASEQDAKNVGLTPSTTCKGLK